MNLKNSLAGLAVVGATLFPSHGEAKASNKALGKASGKASNDGLHQVEKHTHPHHLAIGAESDGHKTLGHILYTHELVDHWSIGAGVGLGSSYRGRFAGSGEIVGTFHKGVVSPIFVVGEAGAGVEFVGNKVDPIAKLTCLIGVRLSDTLGLAVGPTVIATPSGVQPAGTANLAIGF